MINCSLSVLGVDDKAANQTKILGIFLNKLRFESIQCLVPLSNIRLACSNLKKHSAKTYLTKMVGEYLEELNQDFFIQTSKLS